MTDSLPLITLYLSERCNSRCIACDYWKNGHRDLSLADVGKLLPELEALHTRDIVISGGEPLLNRSWREIAALLNDFGMRLWLLTSGLALAKHAQAVAELFTSVTVSLDGTYPETYARVRGVDAFENVCKGIRSIARLGVPAGIRVTLQKQNFRELPRFVTLARELGATQLSFLAVDVANLHAFARQDDHTPDLALNESEVAEFRELVDRLEADYPREFAKRFIAQSPQKMRQLAEYFAAVCGIADFPQVRCNAPEFSAVIGADGRVSPCFFIAGPPLAPRIPALQAALSSVAMQELRQDIRAGRRPECKRCVCSMWRDLDAAAADGFSLQAVADV